MLTNCFTFVIRGPEDDETSLRVACRVDVHPPAIATVSPKTSRQQIPRTRGAGPSRRSATSAVKGPFTLATPELQRGDQYLTCLSFIHSRVDFGGGGSFGLNKESHQEVFSFLPFAV